jgi:hypothetical protein
MDIDHSCEPSPFLPIAGHQTSLLFLAVSFHIVIIAVHAFVGSPTHHLYRPQFVFWSLVNIFWVGVLTHPNQRPAVCCHPKEERKKNETNAVDLPAQKKNDHQQKSEKKRKENLMCLYTLSPLAPFIH